MPVNEADGGRAFSMIPAGEGWGSSPSIRAVVITRHPFPSSGVLSAMVGLQP